MLLPNKLISYDQSILPKFPVVLKELKNGPMSVHDLYKRVIKKMSGVSEFIDTLDCLYALGKIEFEKKRRCCAMLYEIECENSLKKSMASLFLVAVSNFVKV